MVCEQEDDFEQMQVVDRYYEKEIKEMYKRRPSPAMDDEQFAHVAGMTLEELHDYKLKKALEIKKWEKTVPSSRGFFISKRANTAQAKAEPKFKTKPPLNSFLRVRVETAKADTQPGATVSVHNTRSQSAQPKVARFKHNLFTTDSGIVES